MTDPIKQKIQSLVPEVMKLKFGCEILCRVGESEHLKEKEIYVGGPMFIRKPEEKPYFRNQWDMHVPNDSIVEILGSPITLAVVLRAINGGQPFSAQDQAWCDDVLNLLMHERGAWNLAKDNYGEQSPETKAFIGQLLGVSE